MALPPLLDRDELLHRIGNDVDFLSSLAELFREDCPRHLRELDLAVAANDLERLRNTAHSLKGSSGNIGGKRAAEAALRLELVASAGELKDVHQPIHELKTEIKQLQLALDTLIESYQSSTV